MSIVVEGTGSCRTDRRGFTRGLACFLITESSSSMAGMGPGGDQTFSAESVSGNNVIRKRQQLQRSSLSFCSSSSSSSTSSSIGRNSDLEGEFSDCDEESEIQSSFDTMAALEQVLPIRRGISKFYSGKSKSFTSLLEASSSCSSMKEIAKPENAYSRKRKNQIASNNYFSERSCKKSNINNNISIGVAEISKRVKQQCCYRQRDDDEKEHLDASFLFPPLRLMERTKRKISGRRSFSFMNLQCPSATANNFK